MVIIDKDRKREYNRRYLEKQKNKKETPEVKTDIKQNINLDVKPEEKTSYSYSQLIIPAMTTILFPLISRFFLVHMTNQPTMINQQKKKSEDVNYLTMDL